jgi:SAM-dependent methyltransferase
VRIAQQRDQEDFAFLLASANEGQRQGLSAFIHLDQPIGILNYIRIANGISRQVAPGRLLDWGCGLGQMTYLLRRRGFAVTAYDLGDPHDQLPDIPLCRTINVLRTPYPTALPFVDKSFDSALSCGVLEHVDEYSQPGNERLALQELHRVLRPGGRLLIYQLPQEYAWQEAIIRRAKLGYAHPRRYSEREIRALLRTAGYCVKSVRRANLIPKNLTGMPRPLRQLYSRFSRPLIALDGLLCQIPTVNQLAGVLEIDAMVM